MVLGYLPLFLYYCYFYSYVKMYLIYNGQRIAKKKTHVKKRTLNPVFNESFVFEVPAAPNATNGNTGASLDHVALELLLLDWDRVTKNEVCTLVPVEDNTHLALEGYFGFVERGEARWANPRIKVNTLYSP